MSKTCLRALVLIGPLICASCDRQKVESSDLSQNNDSSAERPKFEYLVTYLEAGRNSDKLNSLGSEGWELVAIHAKEESARDTPFYFKREIKKPNK